MVKMAGGSTGGPSRGEGVPSLMATAKEGLTAALHPRVWNVQRLLASLAARRSSEARSPPPNRLHEPGRKTHWAHGGHIVKYLEGCSSGPLVCLCLS